MTTRYVLDLYMSHYGSAIFHAEDDAQQGFVMAADEWVELNRPGAITLRKQGKKTIVEVAE